MSASPLLIPKTGTLVPRWGRVAREWMLLVGVTGGIGLCAVYAALHERARTGVEEQQRLEAQVRTLDDRIGTQLAMVAGILDGVRNAPEIFDRTDQVTRTSQRLKALSRLVPGVKDIQLVDADGIVRAAVDTSQVGRDVSATPIFQGARARIADPLALRVARTQASGGIAGSAIALARPIEDSNGFTGAVFAVLDEQRLSAVLSDVIHAPDMRLALVNREGVVLASVSGSDAAGESSELSGGDRLVARYQVQTGQVTLDDSLFVVASRSLTAIHAGWRSGAAVIFGIYWAAALAGALALHLLQRRRRAREDTLASALQVQLSHAERLDFILSGANIGLWDWDVTGRSMTFSQRWYEMLGLQKGDIGSGDRKSVV